jgi:hypothetical protein
MIAFFVILTFLAAVALDSLTRRLREAHKGAEIIASPSPSHS